MDLRICSSKKLQLEAVTSSVLETREAESLPSTGSLLAERRDKTGGPLVRQSREWNVCARTAVDFQKDSLRWLGRIQADCMEEVAFEVDPRRQIGFNT